MNRLLKRNFLAFLVALACCCHAANGLLKPITTECYFFRSNSSLLCNTSVGIEQCSAKLVGLATEFRRYAIGEVISISGESPNTWYRIYPKKHNEKGWWHNKNIKNLDTKLSIHSMEKNTHRDDGVLVDDSICWSKLSATINTSKTVETITVDRYTKKLFGNHPDVKTIGMLYVV